MTDDNLTPKEAALLVLLMAEARDVSNTELKDRYRLTVDADNRKKLNRLGYVETDTGQRPHVHRLTDAGWARCYRPLELESPRARAQGAALSSLLGAVLRHLQRSSLSLAEFATDDAGPAEEATGGRSVEEAVRAAYGQLAAEPGAWVSFTDLRAVLNGLDRDRLDAALRELEHADDVHIVPESNQKALTPGDRDAALWIGGQYRHAIAIGR